MIKDILNSINEIAQFIAQFSHFSYSLVLHNKDDL